MGKKETKTIEILQHNVKYRYNNDQDMPEHEEEHVQQMITDGYSSGELNDSTDVGDDLVENHGWWEINN